MDVIIYYPTGKTQVEPCANYEEALTKVIPDADARVDAMFDFEHIETSTTFSDGVVSVYYREIS